MAEFILTLADDENGVGAYVRAFVAADDLPLTIKTLKTEIAHINAGERDYDYRHRRGIVSIQRVAHVLDAIEFSVLPDHPRAAFDLLVEVVESDEPIANQCGDADGQSTFDRACGQLLTAARSMDPSETGPIIERLIRADDYGFRRRLSRV